MNKHQILTITTLLALTVSLLPIALAIPTHAELAVESDRDLDLFTRCRQWICDENPSEDMPVGCDYYAYVDHECQDLQPSTEKRTTNTATIPAGVIIPVTHEEKTHVVVEVGDTLELILRTADDIIDSRRRVLIPRNTQIIGKMKPANSGTGTRFIGWLLFIANGSCEPINASSAIHSTIEQIGGTRSSPIMGFRVPIDSLWLTLNSDLVVTL